MAKVVILLLLLLTTTPAVAYGPITVTAGPIYAPVGETITITVGCNNYLASMLIWDGNVYRDWDTPASIPVVDTRPGMHNYQIKVRDDKAAPGATPEDWHAGEQDYWTDYSSTHEAFIWDLRCRGPRVHEHGKGAPLIVNYTVLGGFDLDNIKIQVLNPLGTVVYTEAGLPGGGTFSWDMKEATVNGVVRDVLRRYGVYTVKVTGTKSGHTLVRTATVYVFPYTGVQRDQTYTHGVDAGNGNFVAERTDIPFGNPGPSLDVVRFYNGLSVDRRINKWAREIVSCDNDTFTIPAPFGAGWSSPLAAALFPVDLNDTTGDIIYFRDGTGAYYWFRYNDVTGGYDGPAELPGVSLTRVSAQDFFMTDKYGTRYEMSNLANHDSSVARVTKVREFGGAELTISYSNNAHGLINEITAAGRTLKVEYHPFTELISKIEVPDLGWSWEYAYDDVSADWGAYLMAVTGYIDSGYDDVVETYAYDGAGRLTGIARQGKTVAVEYDAYGRATAVSAPGSSATVTYAVNQTDVVDNLHNATTYKTHSHRCQVEAIDGSDGMTYLGWSADGNLAAMYQGSDEYKFGYDSLGNMLSATTPNMKYNYTYDVLSNVTRYDPNMDTTDIVYYGYTAKGFLQSVTQNGKTTLYADHDIYGRPWRIIPPAGSGLAEKKMYYDSRGNLESYTGSSGTLTYDIAGAYFGRPNEVVQDGLTTRHEYLPWGATTRQEREGRDGTREEISWEYAANGEMTSRTDPGGFVTNYVYDGAGRVTGERQADVVLASGGAPTALATVREYNGRNELARTVDAAGGERRYLYDGWGRVVREEWTERLEDGGSPQLCWQEYGYDSRGRRVTTGGNATTAEAVMYGRGGRVDARTSNGITTNYTYGTGGRQTGWGSAGRIVQRNYVSRNLTETIHPWGLTEREIGDGYGRTGRSERAAAGSDELGWTAYTYDDHGRQATVTEQGGDLVRSYAYDEAGRQTEERINGRITTARTYDGLGRIKTSTTDGVTTTYTYDAGGRLVAEESPLGKVARTYNAAGWLLEETARGVTTRYGYDAAGRKVSEEVAGSGAKTVYEYSEVRGLLLRQAVVATATGAVQREWRYAYDALGNTVKEEQPGGYVKQYVYAMGSDGAYRLRRVLDNAGHSEDYVYNEYGEVIRQTTAGGNERVFAYDAGGRRIREGLAGEEPSVRQWEYDGLGRTIMERWPDGGRWQSYAADMRVPRLMGNLAEDASWQATYTARGNVANRQYGALYEQYHYTPEERLAEYSTGAEEPGVSYNWDNDRVARLMYQARQQEYNYDVNGRLASVGSNPDAFPDRSIIYDGAGRIATMTLPGGCVLSRTYTVTGELASEQVRNNESLVVWRAEYSYDEAGNRTVERIGVGDAVREYRYEYDVAGRLAASENPGGVRREYGYDNRGNRVSERTRLIDHDEIISENRATFSPHDELLQRVTLAGGSETQTIERRAYDGRGRLIQRLQWDVATILADEPWIALDSDIVKFAAPTDSTAYRWDMMDNLTMVDFSDARPDVSYAYDGGNLRIMRACGNDTVFYVYDQTTDNVIGELDAQHKLRAWYVVGRSIDDLVAKYLYDTGGNITERVYYLDTTRPVREQVMYDENGNEVLTYASEAFGSPTGNYPLTPDLPRFTAKMYDPATGMFYFATRWYDPQTGRFISRDPVEATVADLDYNPYVYCKNNPGLYVDPSGRENVAIEDSSDATTTNVNEMRSYVNVGGIGLGISLVTNGKIAGRINGTDFYMSGCWQEGMYRPINGPTGRLYIYKAIDPTKVYMLDYHALEGSNGRPLWHHNQRGVAQILGIQVAQHVPTKNAAIAGNVIRVLKWGGNALFVIGTIQSGVEIYHAENWRREFVRQSGGMIGAYVGARTIGNIGMAGGGALGRMFGGRAGTVIGTTVGGFGGAAVGGYIGFWSFRTTTTYVYETVVEKLEDEQWIILSD